MISQVAASERELAQTIEIWGCRTANHEMRANRNVMESTDREGEIPVLASKQSSQRNPEYDGTREILSEAGGTSEQERDGKHGQRR